MGRTGTGFGIDIGGSGIKAAPVDLRSGALAGDRLRVDTPHPATPHAVASAAADLVARHGWPGPVGVCLPAVVQHGIVRTAANIDRAWVGVDAARLFVAAIGRPVTTVNDADAAGVAEMTWGAGRDRSGVVICLTLGTGIGSGMFVDGVLVPNTELGHLELDGHDAETRASAKARERENLSWHVWAERVERYVRHVVALFSPDLVILGGGVSRRPEKWFPDLDVGCELRIAELANNAGIAGAALLAPVDPSAQGD